MCSPDTLDRIREQSDIARRAIAEAQDIIAGCIAAIERDLCATRPNTTEGARRTGG